MLQLKNSIIGYPQVKRISNFPPLYRTCFEKTFQMEQSLCVHIRCSEPMVQPPISSLVSPSSNAGLAAKESKTIEGIPELRSVADRSVNSQQSTINDTQHISQLLVGSCASLLFQSKARYNRSSHDVSLLDCGQG
jgi:hypothetical protein